MLEILVPAVTGSLRLDHSEELRVKMGISSHYEIIPASLLSRFASNPDLRSAFVCLWGYGCGMYSWFDEIAEDEVEDGAGCSKGRDAGGQATNSSKLSSDTEMEELQKLKTELLKEMREYMDEADVGYDESHIRECAAILDRYSNAISLAENRAAGLECVREAVLALNDLNARAGGELIETMEREEICSFIIRAGAARGFFSVHEDVTKEWREW